MRMGLKLAVLRLGEPQYVIAARADMSETRFSRILRGRVEPTVAEKKKLCEVLKAPLEQLFSVRPES